MSYITTKLPGKWVTVHKTGCVSGDEHESLGDAARSVMRSDSRPTPCGSCFPESKTPGGFCRWIVDFALRAAS